MKKVSGRRLFFSTRSFRIFFFDVKYVLWLRRYRENKDYLIIFFAFFSPFRTTFNAEHGCFLTCNSYHQMRVDKIFLMILIILQRATSVTEISMKKQHFLTLNGCVIKTRGVRETKTDRCTSTGIWLSNDTKHMLV